MSKFCVLLVTLLFTTGASARPEFIREVTTDGKFESHRINSLPGAPEVGFGQYSGYITVDEKAGRALFYWLFEADVTDPQSAPLTLWLNGGPGCSSVGGGALSELGPFWPTKDGKNLVRNPYSWNQVSNLIFLESPAGVGFSYSNTSEDLTTGDAETAADSVEFILRFLELYPVYAKRPFYISGESYAGHYIPQLAAALLEKNEELGDAAVNFKGIAIGNAWTDSVIDNYGTVFYWWTHALISDKSYNGIMETCNFSAAGREPSGRLSQVDCTDYLDEASYQLGRINVYEIYVDFCVSYAAQAEIKQFAKQLNRRKPGALGVWPLMSTDSYDPCVDDEVDVYLNQPEVQKALHADVPGLPYRWAVCSDILDYSYEDFISSVIPVYDILLKSGLQILIYSGDTDAVVPVTGTRVWLNTLGLKVKKDWRPYLVNSQVGGYVTEFDGLTFATVRGAGHMVPYMQPERGLHLFKSFLDNAPL